MTRLEKIAANYKSLAEEYPESSVIQAMLDGPLGHLLAVAEAARKFLGPKETDWGHEHVCRFLEGRTCNCAKRELRAALAPLLEKAEEPPIAEKREPGTGTLRNWKFCGTLRPKEPK